MSVFSYLIGKFWRGNWIGPGFVVGILHYLNNLKITMIILASIKMVFQTFYQGLFLHFSNDPNLRQP